MSPFVRPLPYSGHYSYHHLVYLHRYPREVYLMFLRILKVFPFLLLTAHPVVETTGQAIVDVVDYDAVWVPADYVGPIVAAPFDDHIFKN